MGVDVDWSVHRGECALGAVFAGAYPAACADGGCGTRVYVESIGVDGSLRMACFASKPDGEEFAGVVKSRPVVAYGPGDPQVISPIGHLCDLAHDGSGVGECFVDVP